MTGDSSSSLHKAYGITNIKARIPLLLNLDHLNYDSWRELFSTHCFGFDFYDHIDGSYDSSTTGKNPSTPDSLELRKLDSIVKLWIYTTITQDLLQYVLKKDATAREVWLNLEKLFRYNKEARSIQLDNELRNISIGDMNITSYCNKIKSLDDLLASIDSPVSDRHLVTYIDSPVSNRHLVTYTLNGLTAKWDHVASIIRYRSPLPTFLETRSMLLMEEHQLNSLRVNDSSSQSSSPTVLHSDQSNFSRNNSRNQQRNGGRNYHRNNSRSYPNRRQPNARYGWVFIPPPPPQHAASRPPPSYHSRTPWVPRSQQAATPNCLLQHCLLQPRPKPTLMLGSPATSHACSSLIRSYP